MADKDNTDLEYKKQLYDQYMSERQSLLQTKKETVNQLDKALLTLNAGALAISITFLKEIAPKPSAWTIVLLILGWTAFIASLITTLLSFRKSAEAFDRQLQILDNEAQRDLHGNHGCGEQNDSNNGQEDQSKNKAADSVKRLNLFSLWSFILGVVLLCAFAGVNMWTKSKGAGMPNKEGKVTLIPAVSPKDVKTGVEPPRMPIKPPQAPPQKEKSSK